MKKIVILLCLVASSMSAGAQNIMQVWSQKDRNIYPALEMLIFTQQDMEQKEKLTLPHPYSYYTQLLALSKKFKFSVADMPEEGRAFLDVIIGDVSGPEAVSALQPILHKDFPHKELQLSVIYYYITQRYSKQDKLRWQTYERIIGKPFAKEFKKHELKYVETTMRAFVESQRINR
jgi:hypothetical protein